MTPLSEPPPPAGQLSDAALEAIYDAIQTALGAGGDAQAITRAAWAAGPGPRFSKTLRMMALAEVDEPAALWFRDLARLALSSVGEGS